MKDAVAEGQAPCPTGRKVAECHNAAISMAIGHAFLKQISGRVHVDMLMRDRHRILAVQERKQENPYAPVEVVSEKLVNGVYHVKIYTKPQRDREGLITNDLLNRHRFIHINAKEMMGGRQPEFSLMKRELRRYLGKNKLVMIDCDTIRNRRVNAYDKAARQGQRKAIEDLGRYLLTDYIIVSSTSSRYSQKTGEIYSAWAEGYVTIYRASSRTSPLVVTKQIKGFGGDEGQACRDALQKLSATLAAETMKKLPHLRTGKYYVATSLR
ncbi:MAG: hypothetical protein WCW53_05035 [Syntrophales bacterium]|jgi:hypothetical protein